MDKKNILIVDDEDSIRIMLMRMIEPLGYQLFEAPDGQAAFEMMAEMEFDLVISDLLMPRMDGLALLKAIREAGIDSAFILLTAYGDLPQALDARDQFNIANFLVKPIHNMDQFLFDVEAAISRRILEKENLSLMESLQELNRVLEAKVEERTSELREKNSELDRLSNFRADVLKVLGHELRTPLAILKGYHHLKEQTPDLREQIQARMGSSIERLQDRVEKALSLLRGSVQVEFPLEMAQVDLKEVCTTVINRIEPFITPRGIQLELMESTDKSEGLWDREKLEEIVEELLLNAVRASQDNAQIRIGLTRENGQVILDVTDPGVGVPADQLERIFEPFVTLGDPNHHKSGWVEYGAQGIGIGLSTVKRWIELHGGTITARLNEGTSGTTLTMCLPNRASPEESEASEGVGTS